MGSICSTSDSTSVATVNLILHDGRLQNFSSPVKVWHVMLKNPTCFICNSDLMVFDDVVTAMRDDDELQPGLLYFALPLSWLKRPIRAEEMAVLAVKASSSLMRSGCMQGSVVGSDAVYGERDLRAARVEVGGGRRGELIGKKMKRRSGGGHRFTTLLSVVPEE